MELKKNLILYKEITNKLIKSVGNIEEIERLIKERQGIIDKINLIDYKTDEFKVLATDLNLIELEEELIRKVKNEKTNAQKSFNNIAKLKKARSLYGRRESSPVFFNVKSY